MSADWPLKALSELVDERGITYGVVQPGKPQHDGTPLLRVNNFENSRLTLDTVVRIDPRIASRYTRSKLQGGEILITLVGTPGLVARAPKEVVGWNVARAVGVIPVVGDLQGDWIAWYLRGTASRQYIDSRLNTTVQKTLNLRDLSGMEIPLPPEDELRRICGVLGALDGKIEANLEQARHLDQLVQVLYDRALSQDGDQWSLERTDKVAQINAKSHSAKSHPEEIVYLDIASTSTRHINERQRLAWKAAPSRARRIVSPGDTLISTVRPERKAFVFIPEMDEPLTASTGFAVVSPQDVEASFLHRAVTSERAIRHYSASASGSAYPAVNTSVIAAYEIRVPEDGGAAFGDVARPAELKRWALLQENERITQLRDDLLPRLVVGKLRVSENYLADVEVSVAVQV